MPFIRYGTKNAARAASRTFLLGTTAFSVLATILGLAPGAEYGAASSGLIATGLGYLGAEAQAAVDDPPRPDYTTPTHSKRRRLPVVLGDTLVERTSTEFGEAGAFAASYLSAFVRALERSQMAEQRKASDIVSDRTVEAQRYATRASDALHEVARTTLIVGRALDADEFLRREARQFEGAEGRRLLETPYWEKLPVDTKSILAESDTDPRSFQREWNEVWNPNDPVSSCTDLLRSASRDAKSLATSLRTWGPAELPNRRA